MCMAKDVILEDTIEFKGVPFRVTVADRDMFINHKTGTAKRVNIHGYPVGMDYKPRGWVLCKCRVATIRPDYPYNMKEWTKHVDTQHSLYTPFEVPTKGLIFYGKKDANPSKADLDPRGMAKAVIYKLKLAYDTERPMKL